MIEKEQWQLPSNLRKNKIAYRNTQEARSIEDVGVQDEEGFAKAVDITLKTLLSEANYYGVHTPNPIHAERVRFALRLLHCGFEVGDIVDFASTLDWLDFNARKVETEIAGHLIGKCRQFIDFQTRPTIR